MTNVISWWRVFLKAGGQACVLALLAAICALCVNALRPDGIPWLGHGVEGQRGVGSEKTNLAISLDEAAALYFAGKAVMVDARNPSLYAEGHIAGALNLPWEEFDEKASAVLPILPRGKTIITYCDGEACGLSKELATALLAKGYEKVRVLFNGWSQWLKSGLPVEMDGGAS